MLTKKEFIEIINRLKATRDTIENINNILRNSRDSIEADFVDASSLMVCHEDLVIKLLDNMFDTDMVSYWIYELDYGETFKMGYVSYEENGKIVAPDLSSAEKLYDYLIENKGE